MRRAFGIIAGVFGAALASVGRSASPEAPLSADELQKLARRWGRHQKRAGRIFGGCRGRSDLQRALLTMRDAVAWAALSTEERRKAKSKAKTARRRPTVAAPSQALVGRRTLRPKLLKARRAETKLLRAALRYERGIAQERAAARATRAE